jgi:3-dehydroquinate synthetase
MKELLSIYPSDFNQIYSNEQILSKIKNDKKVSGDFVNAILIKDIGKVEIVKMTLKHFGELIG